MDFEWTYYKLFVETLSNNIKVRFHEFLNFFYWKNWKEV